MITNADVNSCDVLIIADSLLLGRGVVNADSGRQRRTTAQTDTARWRVDMTGPTEKISKISEA